MDQCGNYEVSGYSSFSLPVFYFTKLLHLQGSNLFMGNIGDSRAIMGSKDSNDSMVAIQLTVDLKPDLPSV